MNVFPVDKNKGKCRVCNSNNLDFYFKISRGNVYECAICSALSVYENENAKNFDQRSIVL